VRKYWGGRPGKMGGKNNPPKRVLKRMRQQRLVLLRSALGKELINKVGGRVRGGTISSRHEHEGPKKIEKRVEEGERLIPSEIEKKKD